VLIVAKGLALVTRASSGIGLSLAKELVKAVLTLETDRPSVLREDVTKIVIDPWAEKAA
jgi:NAD(P)-dependent dehydrogenase (short-subunit alcohol dehydrogenase family)